MKKYISSALIILATSALFGEIKMPAIFGDNMMFQQQKSINIWGTAEPNSSIKAEFNGKKTETKTDAKGNWKMSLHAEKSSFDAKELTLSENGKLGKTFKNILVGEIWIAGGQSNMEWKVKNSTDKEKAKENAKKLNGKMRYFLQSSGGFSKTPKAEFQDGAKWIIVDDTNVEGTSAVGFYFAERLLKDIDAPVAIIYASKGAANMATWTDKQTLLNGWTKDYKPFADLIKTLETYDEKAYQEVLAKHKEKLAKHDAAVAKAKKEGKKPPTVHWDFRYPPTRESPVSDFKTPTIHFNGKIAPMRNFAVRGVIWYQGESDADKNLLNNYSDSFGMLISSWRKSLDDADLPFLQVQLASFGTSADWARARDAQLKNTKIFKNVYMAPIVDSGEKHDIHPKDKTIVGSRLEKIALDKIYGKKDVVSDAPEVKSVRIKKDINNYSSKLNKKAKNKGDTAIITFETFGKKLIAKGEPRGFEVLVKDKWIPAKAELKDNTVKVKSPNGEKIESVRYLWMSWTKPHVWLFNEDELPALPFPQ